MPHDIDAILSLYGLKNAQAALLRHNENLTYRIDCEGQSYCLRIKAPVPGFHTSVFNGNPEALLRGELALLQALGEHSNIPVQRPVMALSGDTIVKLPDGTPVSLVTWLDGTPLNAGTRTAEMLVSAGQTLALLRDAAEKYPALNTYDRLAYNPKLLERLAVIAENSGAYLPAEIIRSITNALRAISDIMAGLDQTEAAMISHADPGFGNMVWFNGRVGLIDWSLSGYAHSYMDPGGLMGATSDREEQKLLLQGWESVRGKADRRCLDAYFALTVLLFVCCQHTRAKEWADWFPQALLRWQETIFDPLSSGKPIPCIL